MSNILGAAGGVIVNSAAITTSAASAVWTPASGKTLRLLGYRVHITPNRAATTEGTKSYTMTCAGTTLVTSYFHAPAASATATTPFETGWIDFEPGLKAAASSSALNVTLSTTLINGVFTIITKGVEE